MGAIEIIGGIGAGLLTGFLGSMLGLGGGFIMVPILAGITLPALSFTLGFGLEMQHAVGTSLAIMIFTATSSSIGYWRQGRIDGGLACCLAITSVPCVVGGALISAAISSQTLRLIFGIALCLAAVKMFTGKKALASHGFRKYVLERRIVDREGAVFEYNVNMVFTMIFAGVAGLSAGLLGIGGGIICVPVLTFSGLPIHLAVATSSFLIIFNAVTGAASHHLLGHIEYIYVLLIAPGVIVGAQFGAMASKRFKPRKLSLILAVVLFLLALRMIARSRGLM